MSELSNTYEATTSWLFQQFPSYQVIGSKAYKPTLENVKKVLSFIDHPEKGLQIIHVAGSNGKGSTCSMLASILTEAGYKVGLFTSPHISDFRERIRVNGTMISEAAVIDFVARVRNENWDFAPSFFEVTFALSLAHFAQEKCDICILETGLGGRLDATNVVDPILSVITSISLEHTNILGDTIEAIAAEKAGIIKEGKPVVVGMNVNAVTAIMRQIAMEKSSPYYQVTALDTTYTAPLLGEHQQENLSTVLQCTALLPSLGFAISSATIVRGLANLHANTGFVGRLQIVDEHPTVIMDVSHNPDGIRQSLKAVQAINKGKLHIIYGSSADKEIVECVKLFPSDATIYFTTFSNERSIGLEEFKGMITKIPSLSITYYTDPKEALEEAKKNARETDTILVIGSFFLIADFF